MDTNASHDDVVIEQDGSEELSTDDAAAAGGKLDALKKELASVKKERQEYLDGWQRAKADYVNAHKRFEEEKKAALELGKTLTIGAFLPVMDSLARAQSAGSLPEPFAAIARQLEDASRALAMKAIGEVGEKFDPVRHEALGQDAVTTPEADDTITVVLESGWESKGFVIRPAKVRVGHYEG